MSTGTILTLQSLTDRIQEMAERAFNVGDRYSEETDAELAAKITVLTGIAESCVWGRETDYDDQQGLKKLGNACDLANRAWTYLLSECPVVQRTLKAPSEEDRQFIYACVAYRRRSNTPYCRVLERQDRKDALSQIRVFGSDRATTLDTVLFACRSLKDAQRVLEAIGLQVKFNDAGQFICQHHPIVRYPETK